VAAVAVVIYTTRTVVPRPIAVSFLPLLPVGEYTRTDRCRRPRVALLVTVVRRVVPDHPATVAELRNDSTSAVSTDHETSYGARAMDRSGTGKPIRRVGLRAMR